jgi:hypothetical protein
MQVFTQRIQLRINAPEWAKPKRGEAVWHDEFLDAFNAKYPNKLITDDHPLDYCIVLAPISYIMGYYWGDETTLEAARAFADGKNRHDLYNTSYYTEVFTCDDDQHPTNVITNTTLMELESSENRLNGTKVAGYYLRSAPDIFVSVA